MMTKAMASFMGCSRSALGWVRLPVYVEGVVKSFELIVRPGLRNNRLATSRAVSCSYSHPDCALLLQRVEDNT